MESDEALVAAINAERAAQDVTLQQLADATGISYQSVQRYLDNKRPIRQPDVIKIAKALDVKLSELWLEAERRMGKARAQEGADSHPSDDERPLPSGIAEKLTAWSNEAHTDTDTATNQGA